ncbi:hypothetical protein [Pectinatus frisingensis]|uniref:hypothetical protein n=1 Tax=Pectinatus frisingensis TaxID=865 RepID=UPI0015F63B82|nr:hypothetical protein [Pectinatus frisingensis]
MAKAGDCFVATFTTPSQLGWGEYRKTHTRERRPNECYIPIRAEFARRFELYNANVAEGLGNNIFNAYSIDGMFRDVLKMQGCSKAGDIKAKNISVEGNLTGLYNWFQANAAQVGDQVELYWETNTTIRLTFISRHN